MKWILLMGITFFAMSCNNTKPQPPPDAERIIGDQVFVTSQDMERYYHIIKRFEVIEARLRKLEEIKIER